MKYYGRTGSAWIYWSSDTISQYRSSAHQSSFLSRRLRRVWYFILPQTRSLILFLFEIKSIVALITCLLWENHPGVKCCSVHILQSSDPSVAPLAEKPACIYSQPILCHLSLRVQASVLDQWEQVSFHGVTTMFLKELQKDKFHRCLHFFVI